MSGSVKRQPEADPGATRQARAPRIAPPGPAPERAARRKRRGPAAVAVAVVVLSLVGLLFLLNRTGVLAAPDAVPGVVVTRGEFVRRVIAEGNLEAVEATLLGPPPQSRGTMRIAWLAPDGSRVKKGDVVVRFDPTDMEKKLRDGEGDRRSAESRIAEKTVRDDAALTNLKRDADIAELDLEHTSRFASKDADVFSRVQIVESEIDGDLASRRKSYADQQREIRGQLSEIDLALLGIQKGKAELAIREARTGLEDLELEAPHDGTFVLKDIWGTIPAVGVTVWGGNPVAEIPQLDKMQAKVYVLEADAGGLKVGLPATVELEAHPGREYQATVKAVDALAMRRSRRTPVQYFGVVLELEVTDPDLMKPGGRVRATLMLARQPEAIAVPRQAVFERNGKNVVYVARGSGFEPVEVTLGTTGLGRVVVASGIEDGDRVALRDPSVPLVDADDPSQDAAGGPLAGAQ